MQGIYYWAIFFRIVWLAEKSTDRITKTAYSNLLKILQSKTDIFQIKKKFWYFSISSQNIDYGYSLEPPRRGGSNEYPQSMFLSRNK